MEASSKIDIRILNEYYSNGLLLKQTHPIKPLIVWNYSGTVQFEKLWNEILIKCRGLVTDYEGNIIGRSFPKFFNYEEVIETINIDRPFEVYEKLDGSIINLYYHNKTQEWVVSSRGSFTSDHAKLAYEITKNKIDFKLLSSAHTYIFELISPINGSVVNYGDMEDLLLLGVIQTDNGFELSYDEMIHEYGDHLNIVKRYFKYDDKIKINDLKSYEEDNREGFVVKFKNNERIKIKFDEYVRLHKIITNVSNKTIWRYLMDDLSFDELLNNVPDEFYNNIKETINDFKSKYIDFELKILKEFYRIYHVDGIVNRKKFAEAALKSNNHSFLFALYDCKSYEKAIWKKLKPNYIKKI